MNLWYQLHGVLWTTGDFRGYTAVTCKPSEFVLEVNRGNGWEPTSWSARCLRAAHDLREWVKQQFPTYKYRVVSVLSDEVSPYKWEPVLAGPYQFPYRLSLSDEEYAQVTTPV